MNSIVSFALEVRNLAKTIERKDLHQYLSNRILLKELVDQLPTNWAKHIAHVPDNLITLTTLSDWLHVLMTALIKVTDFVPQDSDKKYETKPYQSKSERINVHQEGKDNDSENFNKMEINYQDKRCEIYNRSCISIEMESDLR